MRVLLRVVCVSTHKLCVSTHRLAQRNGLQWVSSGLRFGLTPLPRLHSPSICGWAACHMTSAAHPVCSPDCVTGHGYVVQS